jgi:hypothetical protein
LIFSLLGGRLEIKTISSSHLCSIEQASASDKVLGKWLTNAGMHEGLDLQQTSVLEPLIRH